MASMQGFPPRPSVETALDDAPAADTDDDADAPAADTSPTADASAVDAAASHDPFGSGHLWVTELVAGDPLRFRLTDAGFLEFGDRNGVFDHDAVPLRYRAAVGAVRERFARDAFAAAVDTPGSVTFFGVATHARGLAYDLDRVPPFLGTAVHDADRERYLPPDTVRRAFDLVGIPTTEPVDKEVRAAHFDPADYPIPDSRYRDGPAAGVVFHNKAGGSAVRRNPAVQPSPGVDADDERPVATGGDRSSATETRPDPERPATADALVDALVDDTDIDRAVSGLVAGTDASARDGTLDADTARDGTLDADTARGDAADDTLPPVEAIVDRLLERLARETSLVADADTVDGSGEPNAPDETAIRSVLAARVDRYRRERT